jgi:hypothetical protein
MRTQGRIRSFNSIQQRIESKSRGEAERQARKVSWLTLLECRKRYIEWEAFTLWAHAVEEAEHQAPEWLARVVAGRCPGIASQKGEKLWKCLDTWKHETLFAKPNREGWMRGVSFFAVRELAYARNWAYWAYCEQQWSVRRPAFYPSFDDWRSAAEDCPGEVLDSSGLRKERKAQIKAAARAGKERLERAVGIYLELEAFAYWLRPMVDARLPLSGPVLKEFRRRYPAIEMCSGWTWNQVWARMRHSHLQEAEAGGWLDAVVYTAELHPRRTKVIDYWLLYWAGHWPRGNPELCPSFKDWRREAESYRPEGGDLENTSSISG